MKPIVKYAEIYSEIVVGIPVLVCPINHPDQVDVPNDTVAITTPVVAYDKSTGTFETRNTMYIPA